MPVIVTNAEAFAIYIEKLVINKHMDYREAVLAFCEARQIEPADIVPFLSDKIKHHIAREARALHLLPADTDVSVFND